MPWNCWDQISRIQRCESTPSLGCRTLPMRYQRISPSSVGVKSLISFSPMFKRDINSQINRICSCICSSWYKRSSTRISTRFALVLIPARWCFLSAVSTRLIASRHPKKLAMISPLTKGLIHVAIWEFSQKNYWLYTQIQLWNGESSSWIVSSAFGRDAHASAIH
jgi:hypothetical protein